jgi:hypothetical protein
MLRIRSVPVCRRHASVAYAFTCLQALLVNVFGSGDDKVCRTQPNGYQRMIDDPPGCLMSLLDR